jgi:hypothetical protein
MAVRIPIVTDFDGKGLERAFKAFKELETTGQKATFALKQAFVPATIALAGLTTGLTMAAKAAAEDDRAQAELERQIQATTSATVEQVAASSDFIDSMQMQYAVADSELRPALASLVRGSQDLGQAQKDLVTVLDVSAATGKSVTEVADAVSKAYGGNTKALKQLSPELFALIKDGASVDQVMASLADTMGGAATAAANSAEGQMKRLGLAFGEAKESIGRAFLPVIEAIVPLLTDMAGVIERNAPLITGLATALGVLAGAIVAANLAITAWKAVGIITTGINYALATSFTAVEVATGIGIAAVVAGIGALALYQRELAKVKAQAAATNLTPGGGGFVGPQVSDLPADIQKGFWDRRQKITGGAGAVSDAVDKMAQRIAAARKEIQDRFSKALDDANRKLERAREAYNNYASELSGSVKGTLSFTDALREAADASGGINDKTSFIGGLTVMAERSKLFGEKLRTLLKMGLSESALRQVAEAGVEAGTYIADQLIDGGSATIEQTNALVASLESVADTLGTEGADKFYGAGVAQGEALVAGIQSVIDKYNAILANPNLTLPQIKAIGASADAALTGVIAGVIEGPSAPTFDVAQFQQDRLGDQYNITVYGGLNSSAEQGRAVIDAIKAANRADGPADILVR